MPPELQESPPASAGSSQVPLSAQALKFVDEYVSDPSNATAAAKRAGYSIETAPQSSSRLMADPRVKALIADSLDKAIRKIGISAERVIQRYWQIANASPGDIVRINEDGEAVVDTTPVAETSVTLMGGRGQKKLHSITHKTVKTADQLKALDSVSEILGLFPKEKEQTVNLTFAQLVEASIPKTPPRPQISEINTNHIEAS